MDYKDERFDQGIDLDNFSLEEEIAKFDSLKPCGEMVLLRIYTCPPKTSGGIIVPEKTTEESAFQNSLAVVMKMGPDAANDPNPRCKVGDWAIFDRVHPSRRYFFEDPTCLVPLKAIDLVTDKEGARGFLNRQRTKK